jgi:hypothetical protein
MEKLTLSLSQPIATGCTSDIHSWQEGQLLKLFHNWFELENIEYEARIVWVVHTSRVSIPAVGEA